MSDRASHFFGADAEVLFQDLKKLESFVFPDDKEYLLAELAKLKNDATSLNIEFRLLLRNKEVKWVQLKAFDLQPTGQLKEVAGFLEDITRRKDYELNLY